TFLELILLGAIAAVVPVSPVMAQPASVEPGHAEVFGFGGGYFGDGLAAPAFGGGAGGTGPRHVRVFGEGYYRRKTVEESNIKITASGTGFQGGAHILFPIGESRAVPFASVSYGIARATGSAMGFSASETLSQFGVGGGLDYYVSRKWGV